MTAQELTYKISIALLLYAGEVNEVHRNLSELVDESPLSIEDKEKLKSLFSIELIKEVKALTYTSEKQEAFNAISVVNQFMGDHPLRGIV